MVASEPPSTVDRIVDAAARCFAERGITATSMSRIAEVAGVSRVSLYRYFASRDAVLQAVGTRESMRFMRVLPPLSDVSGGGEEVLAAGFTNAVLFMRENEVLQGIMRHDPTYFLEAANAQSGQLALFVSIVAPVVRVQLGLTPQRARRVTEVVLRLLMSLVVVPVVDEPLEDAAQLQAFIADLFRMVSDRKDA